MMLAMERTATQWIEDELGARKQSNAFDAEHAEVKLQVSPAKWVLP